MNEAALKKELLRRAKALRQQEEKPQFSLAEFCFDKQLEFINDPARHKVAVCSRRSGKTIACAADLVNTALTQQGDVAYITLNRKTAKRIIWRELLRIDRQYQLGCHIDNAELTLTFPNGNALYVSGAKDESDAEKFRGLALRKVYIDECQSFRAYIESLIEDIIEPALTDYYGSLVLIGTPGPVPAGFFYNAATGSGWAQFGWTMQDNPYIKAKSGKQPIEIISELAKRRGLPITDPSIQREYFGKWIKDTNSLVFKFDAKKNVFDVLPSDLTYIFGIDIGYNDADAIAVVGYSHATGCSYLVEEYVQDKSDITTLVRKIEALQQAYQPVKIVMDAGALGKKIQEEIRVRHSLPVEAADKHRKFEYIALMNDDLRNSKFLAVQNSRFEEDAMLVQWDYSNPVKPKISDSLHSDIHDAALYAWREAKHYFQQKPSGPVNRNTDAYMKELEDKEAAALELRKQAGDEFTDISSWEDLGISDFDFDE